MIKKRIYVGKKDKQDFKKVNSIVEKKIGAKLNYGNLDYGAIKSNNKIVLKGVASNDAEYEITILNKRRLLGYLFMLVSLFIGLGTLWYMETHKNTTIIPEEIMPDIEDASKITEGDLKARMQKEVDKGYYNLQINRNIIFNKGDDYGTIKILNPEKNTFPISVNIILDDSGEIIYRSGKIEPNQLIKKGKLIKPLSKGEYSATADVKIYDNESKNVNNPTVKLKITVNN